ncbi:hypothetical protein ASPZODRAFT_127599 [Penicilliopsis zonata CBS 506.65]|uniref:CID domain-containing protein n=1 Tax=Penicilliopsis zonata CBS 506.65 TaxID=1073090 RepID=A0A1L9SWG9_9EURO|nr:hypothetical protein ASPZODRAFT_127599 [Penicilliopsis zonata CBS 506.65]OJJ51516.1 hypothetical protein ASPZODRAFT_127599 [Penicilliopsis zonata CBS 506.65]
MAEDSKGKGFPDLSTKLSAPTKKSLFERQKAEAEAKRARERAETAAVYEDFVKSFEEDSQGAKRQFTDGRSNAFNNNNRAPALGGGGPAKRHFTSSGPRSSGPGTLGPPLSSLSRKRTFDGLPPSQRNRDPTTQGGIFAFENSGPVSLGLPAGFHASDDEEDRAAETKEAERAAARPTLYLASLPPGTSPAAIKALIPSMLAVDNVKILHPPAQSSTDRKSGSAIVTLASESAASDIENAVSSLQNHYLGWGYFLSISRHLSSAAINSTVPVTVGLSLTTSQPFGAKAVQQNFGASLSRAPPPGMHRGGFAPPGSYNTAYGRGGSGTQVEVKAPADLKQLRLIHKTLESLLGYGPEFEALLMSRAEVQREEKWAWLWDPRSVGGVYYRWKLWDILTNTRSREARRKTKQVSSTIFEGGASWIPPETEIKFEYTTRLDEFVSDADYNSSDEEHSDNEDEKRQLGGGGPPPGDSLGGQNDGSGYMNPLKKAKLTHLLARLPTTNARLRRGDVARVTAFAIEHAGAGAEETVEMIVSNVMKPFAYSGGNPDHEAGKHPVRSESVENSTANDDSVQEGKPIGKDNQDLSAAKLVGLYIISDILSTSATSGVRHAWRYRQLFESALKTRRVFEHLGRLEKDLNWGRLKAEKWKRSVGTLLHLWEGWCVFPQSSQEHFLRVFEEPPLSEKELQEEKDKAEAEQAAAAFAKGKNRWKTVDEDATAAGKFDPTRAPKVDHQNKMEIDSGNPEEAEDEDFDGEPMSDIDGVPMEDSDLEEEEGDESAPTDAAMMQDEPQEPAPVSKGVDDSRQQKPANPEREPVVRKPRPKAEDMFADSDSDQHV